MQNECFHRSYVPPVSPSAPGCEECIALGHEWVHLRICLSCGYVGCCDESKTSMLPGTTRRRFIRSRHRSDPARIGAGATSTRCSSERDGQPTDSVSAACEAGLGHVIVGAFLQRIRALAVRSAAAVDLIVGARISLPQWHQRK